MGGLQQLRAGGSLPWVAMVPYRRCCPAGRTEAACSVRRARRVRASKPSRPACWTRPAARHAVPGTTRAQRRQAIWGGAVRCWRGTVRQKSSMCLAYYYRFSTYDKHWGGRGAGGTRLAVCRWCPPASLGAPTNLQPAANAALSSAKPDMKPVACARWSQGGRGHVRADAQQ